MINLLLPVIVTGICCGIAFRLQYEFRYTKIFIRASSQYCMQFQLTLQRCVQSGLYSYLLTKEFHIL
jgi:hypothetical protein